MDDITMKHLAAAVPLVAGLGLLSLKWMQRRTKNPRGLPFPPGPGRWPVIGNLPEIPTEKEWLTYSEWAKSYGDIIYLEALGQPIIILNSVETVGDLFERRSALYSDRPETVFIHQLIDFDWSMALNNGAKWRRQRRAYNPYMNRGAVDNYKAVQLRESRAFLKEMLVNPDFNFQTRQLFGSTMMKICYGMKKDSYIEKAEAAMAILVGAVLPGAYLVDIIPALKYVPSWFPGAGFQKTGADGKRLGREALDEPMHDVKDAMAHGSATPCIATQMLEKIGPDDNVAEEEQLVRDLMGVSFLAGADTTLAYLDSFLLAMVTYPAVQQKAWEELNSIVGPARLPDFSDRPNLPYIEAILLETLRWQPVTPMGLPHYTTADDEYNGYFIPKGAVVLGNAWSILHDPKEYNEPAEFRPERFLMVKDGKTIIDGSVRDPRTAAFGWGRRICVGRFLAENSLWVVMAGMLSTLLVEPEIGEDGMPVIPKTDWCSGAVSRPLPYRCVIKPRSAQAIEVIQYSE